MLCQNAALSLCLYDRNDIANVEYLTQNKQTNKNHALAYENVRNEIFHVSLNRIK